MRYEVICPRSGGVIVQAMDGVNDQRRYDDPADAAPDVIQLDAGIVPAGFPLANIADWLDISQSQISSGEYRVCTDLDTELLGYDVDDTSWTDFANLVEAIGDLV